MKFTAGTSDSECSKVKPERSDYKQVWLLVLGSNDKCHLSTFKSDNTYTRIILEGNFSVFKFERPEHWNTECECQSNTFPQFPEALWKSCVVKSTSKSENILLKSTMKRSDTILSTTTLEMSKSKLQFTYVASSDLLSINSQHVFL